MADLVCADNAHSNDSDNMRGVLCNSTGEWSYHVSPKCRCDKDYRILQRNGEYICEGWLFESNITNKLVFSCNI